MREERQKQQQELRGKIKDILSESQRSRFAELEFQFALERGSAEAALEAAGLELSEADRQKLENAQQEISQRVQEQIAKIQREAQSEILGTVVTGDQIDKLKGKSFTFESEEGPRGFRRGRDSDRPNRPDDAGSDNNDSGGRRSRRR
jgi:hypothetical protein